MLDAFIFSVRLYVKLCLHSLGRHRNLGKLTWRGRLLRVSIYLLFLPLWLTHWLSLFLDEVLFPGYRHTALHRPFFILGVPRSGTTFLHRTISEDKERFTSVRTWEVFLAPSILQKKFWLGLARLDTIVGRPGGRLVRRLERKLFKAMEGVHDMNLEAPEEDYLLLLPMCSCFILFLPFTESRHIWQMARFDWEAPHQDRRRIMTFYKACLQKHLYVFGDDKRYLSKNAAFASWPVTLHDYFPDAEFVVCMREPEQTVPSLLGSLRPGADFFELDLVQGDLPAMLVQMMADYYQHLLERFPTSAPIVHMDALKKDVAATVDSIYRHYGHRASPDYRERLRVLQEQSKRYKPRNHTLQPRGASDRSFYESRFAHYYARDWDLPSAPRIKTTRLAS